MTSAARQPVGCGPELPPLAQYSRSLECLTRASWVRFPHHRLGSARVSQIPVNEKGRLSGAALVRSNSLSKSHVSRRRRSGVIAFAAHFHREVQTEEGTLWVRFDQLMSSGALHIRTSTVRRHDKGPRIVGSSLQRLFILVIVRTNDVERLGFD